MQNAIYLGQET